MSWRKRSQARLAQKLAQMDHAVLVEPWLEAAMPVAAIALIAPNSSVRLRQPEGLLCRRPNVQFPQNVDIRQNKGASQEIRNSVSSARGMQDLEGHIMLLTLVGKVMQEERWRASGRRGARGYPGLGGCVICGEAGMKVSVVWAMMQVST